MPGGSSKRPKPNAHPGGRTPTEGGGTSASAHYTTKSSNNCLGTAPKPGELTDVEELIEHSEIHDRVDPKTGEKAVPRNWSSIWKK
jgi:hypothetical protein